MASLHTPSPSAYTMWAIVFPALLLLLVSISAADDRNRQQPLTAPGIVLKIKGAIGPAVSEYIQQGLRQAIDRNASLVVLMLDTPGGLDRAMRDIVQAVLNSPVPVVSYVAPEGARAASAGTYILYASHIAAMAPATNLGAATPVQIGGFPGSQEPDNEQNKEQQQPPPEPATSMERKMIHDAAAYLRSLADHHGRNAEWADRAVRESVSLTSQEALALQVINVVATDTEDLLRQIDGTSVVINDGITILATSGLNLVAVDPDWKNRILAIISDPNITYLFLLFGMYGLIYELANPGVFFPGVAGAISILIALYGFQVLPVNYSGLALMILGVALMISEAFVPSFGSLGIGGIAAFVAGSVILFDEESLQVSPTLIGITSLASAMFILWLMGRMIALRKQQPTTGSEALLGMTGEVIDDFEGDGRIWLLGESWIATSNEPLKKGQHVQVTAVHGLILSVKAMKGGMR